MFYDFIQNTDIQYKLSSRKILCALYIFKDTKNLFIMNNDKERICPLFSKRIF